MFWYFSDYLYNNNNLFVICSFMKQYLALLRDIKENGIGKDDRTGT